MSNSCSVWLRARHILAHIEQTFYEDVYSGSIEFSNPFFTSRWDDEGVFGGIWFSTVQEFAIWYNMLSMSNKCSFDMFIFLVSVTWHSPLGSLSSLSVISGDLPVSKEKINTPSSPSWNASSFSPSSVPSDFLFDISNFKVTSFDLYVPWTLVSLLTCTWIICFDAMY